MPVNSCCTEVLSTLLEDVNDSLPCTVELQWLELIWNHENIFETGVVRAKECESKRQVRKHNRDIYLIFFHMKLCCMLSLKSSHPEDSNEYTQYTIFY